MTYLLRVVSFNHQSTTVRQVLVPPPGVNGNEVNMDFNSLMEKAYEDYFNSLDEGEEALSFSEFKQILSGKTKATD